MWLGGLSRGGMHDNCWEEGFATIVGRTDCSNAASPPLQGWGAFAYANSIDSTLIVEAHLVGKGLRALLGKKAGHCSASAAEHIVDRGCLEDLGVGDHLVGGSNVGHISRDNVHAKGAASRGALRPPPRCLQLFPRCLQPAHVPGDNGHLCAHQEELPGHLLAEARAPARDEDVLCAHHARRRLCKRRSPYPRACRRCPACEEGASCGRMRQGAHPRAYLAGKQDPAAPPAKEADCRDDPHDEEGDGDAAGRQHPVACEEERVQVRPPCDVCNYRAAPRSAVQQLERPFAAAPLCTAIRAARTAPKRAPPQSRRPQKATAGANRIIWRNWPRRRRRGRRGCAYRLPGGGGRSHPWPLPPARAPALRAADTLHAHGGGRQGGRRLGQAGGGRRRGGRPP